MGRFPTPVHELPLLSSGNTRLWIKRDDLSEEPYGGNKVRKLAGILSQAKERGARRLVTFGAAGSHHVLATAIYGKLAGFRVAAVLVPQFGTAHAEMTLRVALAWGLEAWVMPTFGAAWHGLEALASRHDYIVPPGGSNVEGTLGYVDAVGELRDQICAGALPMPDVIVVALGSGGTASGLLAGIAALNMPTRIVGVRVVEPWLAGKRRTIRLAQRALRSRGEVMASSKLGALFELDPDYLGDGYGCPTPDGSAATRAAESCGIGLDPTYTAKTFSAALHRVRAGRLRNVLYWHTLSAVSGQPRGSDWERLPALPADLRRRLFR